MSQLVIVPTVSINQTNMRQTLAKSLPNLLLKKKKKSVATEQRDKKAREIPTRIVFARSWKWRELTFAAVTHSR